MSILLEDRVVCDVLNSSSRSMTNIMLCQISGIRDFFYRVRQLIDNISCANNVGHGYLHLM